MKASINAFKWAQKAQVLAGTLAIAVVVNLILLLLIASLLNCQDEPRKQIAQLRPVDFVRVTPKKPEPKPEPEPATPPENNIVESNEPPVKKEIHKPADKPVEAKKAKPEKKSAKKSAQVAAPKLDVPLDGTGSSFAGVVGLDSRLTAPPTQWDVTQKPEPPKPAPKGPVNRRLVAVSRVMPTYPWKAKKMNIEGWVKLEVIVATDGSVRQATVIDEQPKDTFADAAIKSIKQWRFQPAFVAGQAVEQRAVQMLEFQLH